MTADWMFLAAAIVLEVAGTVSMKLSHGFTILCRRCCCSVLRRLLYLP